MENRIQAALAIMLLGIGLGVPAHAQQAGSIAAEATDCANKEVNLPRFVVKRCTSTTMKVPLTADESAYYGALALDATSTARIAADGKLVKALRSLFNVRDNSTLALSLSVSDGAIVLYERPLLLIKVGRGGAAQVEFNDTLERGTQITPYFPLKNRDPLQVSLKINEVRDRQGDILGTIKEGISVFAALGGSGWLLTAAKNEELLGWASGAEKKANEFYSGSSTLVASASLDADTHAFKRITFVVETGGNDGKKKPVAMQSTISVYLTTKPSLLTDKLFTDTRAHVPNMAAANLNMRWANLINLGGKPAQSLAAYLDNNGVPTKLEALKLAQGDRRQPVARVEAVDTACKALRTALEGAPLRLSDADRELVLYDELRRGNVFNEYKPKELQCLDDIHGAWATRYELVPPVAPTPIPFADKTSRMERLARHWNVENEADRASEFVAEDFTDPVLLTAPVDLLPGLQAPTTPDAAGLATWPVAPRQLARMHKKCFGNFIATDPNVDWQTGFARFDHLPAQPFLVRATFDTSKVWSSSGPRIKALSITPATAADAAANHNLNCVEDVAGIDGRVTAPPPASPPSSGG